MPIKTPGKHFYSQSPIQAMIHWKRSRRRRKSVVATLMLTPMIDVFAVLTLFLLANFSATGEVLFMQKDIKLPKAERALEIQRSPVVTISKARITLEGENMGESFIDKVDKLSFENWAIPQLTEKLEQYRQKFYTDRNINFPGRVIIQADKDLEFVLIKRVMFTCVKAGYYNINFAVIKSDNTAT